MPNRIVRVSPAANRISAKQSRRCRYEREKAPDAMRMLRRDRYIAFSMIRRLVMKERQRERRVESPVLAKSHCP